MRRITENGKDNRIFENQLVLGNADIWYCPCTRSDFELELAL